MSDIALECRELSHHYGKHTALDHVNLSLPAGRVYGLLGRNGAGKTTLINILSASMFQSSGAVEIFGGKPFERAETLKKLCVVREHALVPPSVTVGTMLASCAKIYPHWDALYAEELRVLFNLNPKKRFKQLSRGMESSLGLIVGLASRAELTVFDEPSLGLDAVAREHFYDQLLHDLERYPRTVILSTHMIDEVSRLFEDVIIIDKGKVLTMEPLNGLLESAVTVTGGAEAVAKACAGHTVLHRDELGGVTMVAIRVSPGETAFENVSVEPLPLQKLFVYLTEGSEEA